MSHTFRNEAQLFAMEEDSVVRRRCERNERRCEQRGDGLLQVGGKEQVHLLSKPCGPGRKVFTSYRLDRTAAEWISAITPHPLPLQQGPSPVVKYTLNLSANGCTWASCTPWTRGISVYVVLRAAVHPYWGQWEHAKWSSLRYESIPRYTRVPDVKRYSRFRVEKLHG